MIEGTFVAFIATMLIFLFMSLLMTIYHTINVSVAANEAAADIAMVYGPSFKDPFMNYTELDYFEKQELYRHSLTKASYDDDVLDKGKWYACFRLRQGEYSTATSGYEVVDVRFEDNQFGKRQIYVTMTRTYKHLTEYPFVLFELGKDSADRTSYTVTATGVAECYDMIDYINWTNFGSEMAASFEKKTDIGKFISEADGVIDTVKSLMKKFLNAIS